jgi:hypothetical protein
MEIQDLRQYLGEFVGSPRKLFDLEKAPVEFAFTRIIIADKLFDAHAANSLALKSKIFLASTHYELSIGRGIPSFPISPSSLSCSTYVNQRHRSIKADESIKMSLSQWTISVQFISLANDFLISARAQKRKARQSFPLLTRETSTDACLSCPLESLRHFEAIGQRRLTSWRRLRYYDAVRRHFSNYIGYQE